MVFFSLSKLFQEVARLSLLFIATIFSNSNEDRDHLTSFHFLKSFIMSCDPPGMWVISSSEMSPCPLLFPVFPSGRASTASAFPAYTEENLARTFHQTEMICWHVSAYIALWFVISAVSTADQKHADGVLCSWSWRVTFRCVMDDCTKVLRKHSSPFFWLRKWKIIKRLNY